jgi:2,4-dienoyl-CoA reductase-like NADH-dependent reductase (Old Yellow Enzyme family)
MTEDGRVTPEMLKIYRDLAEGGVGLIITGYMAVSPQGKVTERPILIYDDKFIPEISLIAEAVHSSGTGCRVMAQINHGGRQILFENDVAECVGPSAVTSPVLVKKARELSFEDIKVVVKDFVSAIRRVKEAGFDGVQLHAAHGYLLSSFLSPYTNRRTDEYGGSAVNRSRILNEIITEARDIVGNFPIIVKLNCDDHVEGGIVPDAFPEIANIIASMGYDSIEVSGGMWDCLARSEKELGFVPVFMPESRTRLSKPESQSYYLGAAEKLSLDIPVILVGGNRNIEKMEEIIRRGKVDFFALSRPLICEPGLPNRWLKGIGSEKVSCVSCNYCIVGIKSQKLKCMTKGNIIKGKFVDRIAPHAWKLFVK